MDREQRFSFSYGELVRSFHIVLRFVMSVCVDGCGVGVRTAAWTRRVPTLALASSLCQIIVRTVLCQLTRLTSHCVDMVVYFCLQLLKFGYWMVHRPSRHMSRLYTWDANLLQFCLNIHGRIDVYPTF